MRATRTGIAIVGARRWWPVIFASVAAVIGVSRFGLAQTAKPSTSSADTKPSTRPAGAETRPSHPSDPPIDPSTPRGTLKLLAVAMRDGDGATMKRVLYAASPSEEKM